MNRTIKFSIWFPIVLVTAFAAGYLFWQKTLIPGPYDLEPVNIMRNNNSNLPRDEVLRGWQTYRNEKYGFEVKYPPDHVVIENKSGFFIRIESKTLKSVDSSIVFDYPDKTDPSLDLIKYHQIDSTESLTVDGISAVRRLVLYSAGYGQRYSVIFQKDNLYYQILSYEVGLFPTAKQSLNQILSMFKFLTAETQKNEEKVCIQVITRAKNPQTGEVGDFPTPCDVPEGWEVIK